jgi:predicted nucleotidyltransferase
MDVAEQIRRLLRRHPQRGVTAAYLFGSHAERRSHAESDVDVGVLLARDAFPSDRLRFEERIRLSSWLSAELGIAPIDLVVQNDVPPGLAKRVVLDGELLACADPEAARAFSRDVQLRAADLEPFLRRTRRTKLAAIAR